MRKKRLKLNDYQKAFLKIPPEVKRRRALLAGAAARAKQKIAPAARKWVGREQERNVLILEYYGNGVKMPTIAKTFGISRQRVKQILDRA